MARSRRTPSEPGRDCPGTRYVVVHLSPGWVGLLSSEVGLRRLVLPQASREQVLFSLREHLDRASYSPSPFESLVWRLESYFARVVVSFDDVLDFGGASKFRQRVWAATRSIPSGQSVSYTWVAETVGQLGAARAVGQALAANPLPIIVPCHRVSRRDGTLGGFSGGPRMKRYLLGLEQAAMAG